MPKMNDGLYQSHGPIAAFHMTLLAQKMNQHVPAMGDLIQLSRHIPELAFGADIMEKDRKKSDQLLNKVKNRINITV